MDSVLRPHPKTTHCCHYRRQKIRSKGAILIIFWTAMFNIFFRSISTIVTCSDGQIILFQYALDALKGCLYLSFPIAGWIADTWFGRYRVIIAGVYISLSGALLVVMAIPISYALSSRTIKEVLISLSYLPLYVGYSCFSANIIQFATDQMIEIGASGEELSAVIHWQYWAFRLGHLVEEMFFSINLSEVALSIVSATVSLMCLSALIISHCCFRAWLTTTPMIANTVKCLYSVLNYARKTKYPRRRSALTYLDEEHPSRIDYGKDKFGGPFTEEEVEDVKTVLRMVPLFVCMLAYGMASDQWPFFENHLQKSENNLYFQRLSYWAVTALIPPIYQLILYPLFYNSVATMLQRAGLGILLTLSSVGSSLAIDSIGHMRNSNVGCMFMNSSGILVSNEWLHIPRILEGTAICILEMSFIEFVIAQTPARMKGLMIGLWYIFRGIGASIDLCLPFPFQYLPPIPPSCGFYFFLTKLVILLLVFVIFLRVSKWYKLRQREVTVNIHAIAEEHWERYMDQREEYERQWGSHDNISCSYGSTDTAATNCYT